MAAFKGPFLRAFGNYDVDAASDESGLKCEEPTLAQQHFADECDINTIVRRFGLDGELPVGVRMPTYGDFTGVVDYHSAANAIALANEAFDGLPAVVRARFQNDPALFVDFCSKEENRDEARKLGMLVPDVPGVAPGAPAAAPVVPAAVGAATQPVAAPAGPAVKA